jgi:hypothetical protein
MVLYGLQRRRAGVYQVRPGSWGITVGSGLMLCPNLGNRPLGLAQRHRLPSLPSPRGGVVASAEGMHRIKKQALRDRVEA